MGVYQFRSHRKATTGNFTVGVALGVPVFVQLEVSWL